MPTTRSYRLQTVGVSGFRRTKVQLKPDAPDLNLTLSSDQYFHATDESAEVRFSKGLQRAAQAGALRRARVLHFERRRHPLVAELDPGEDVVARVPRVHALARIGHAGLLPEQHPPDAAADVRRGAVARQPEAGRHRDGHDRHGLRNAELENFAVDHQNPLAGLLEPIDRRAEKCRSDAHFGAAAEEAAAGLAEHRAEALLGGKLHVAELRDAEDAEVILRRGCRERPHDGDDARAHLTSPMPSRADRGCTRPWPNSSLRPFASGAPSGRAVFFNVFSIADGFDTPWLTSSAAAPATCGEAID